MRHQPAVDYGAGSAQETKTDPFSICLVHRELRLNGLGGGVSTYHKNIAEALFLRGLSPCILARKDVGDDRDCAPVVKGATVTMLENRNFRSSIAGIRSLTPSVNWLIHSIRVALHLRRLSKETGLDIVETPDNAAECLLFALVKKNVRLVIRPQYPSFMYDGIEKTRKFSPNGILFWWLERMQLLLADEIICSSRSLRDMVADGFGIARSRIRVIPLPVEIPDIGPLSELRFPHPTVLYAGKLSIHKGVRCLVDAFQEVQRGVPDVRFVFVGRGVKELAAYVSQQLPGALERDQIEIRDAVPRSELFDLYRRAQVCAFPSLVEPFGYTCAEAMAVGACVIGSKGTGHEDLVEDGESGFLVEPGNVRALAETIIRALTDEGLRLRIGQAAGHRIRTCFSADRVAAEQVKVYQSLLACRS